MKLDMKPLLERMQAAGAAPGVCPALLYYQKVTDLVNNHKPILITPEKPREKRIFTMRIRTAREIIRLFEENGVPADAEEHGARYVHAYGRIDGREYYIVMDVEKLPAIPHMPNAIMLVSRGRAISIRPSPYRIPPMKLYVTLLKMMARVTYICSTQPGSS